jgi:hypothetical protein
MAIYNNDIDPNEIMWENQNNIKNKMVMESVEVKNQTINYTIKFGGNVYNLFYYEDLMSYSEELTEAVSGLPILDEDEYEEVMNFFHDNQPKI